LVNNQYSDDDEDFIYESMSLIDALNLATSTTKKTIKQNITTNDIKYFCSEHTV
jgi:hypothetical protein